MFQCIQCKIEFYSKGRHIKTCQHILDEQPNSERKWRGNFAREEIRGCNRTTRVDLSKLRKKKVINKN